MRPRLVVAASTLGILAAACGGEPPPSISPSASATAIATASPSRSPTPLPTVVPSPTILPDVDLPRDAPSTFGEDVAADDLSPESIAPPNAEVTSAWTIAEQGVQGLAFSWRRGEDPLASQSGFEVWERFDDGGDPWRAVYAFTDGASSGVLGVRFETGDVTRDHVADVLTFEDTGGSGACGTWRVVGVFPKDANEIYAKQTCDTDVRIAGGRLEVRAAVFRPDDAHCCPSAYRITTLAWTGAGWEVEDRRTERV